MLSDPVFKTWVTKLKNPDYHIRNRAAYALGQSGDPRAIPFLLAALGDFDRRDEESKVNMTAGTALAEFGEQALAPLIEALRPDPTHPHDSWRRYWVADALGFFEDPRAVAALIQALDDPERSVVESSAQALERLGAVEALPHLQRTQARFTKANGYVYTAITSAIEALQKA